MSLEEAIEVGADECHCPPETMRHALLLMMPAIRAAIIEECARTAEQYDSDALSWTEDGRKVIQSAVAEAIRALKDKA